MDASPTRKPVAAPLQTGPRCRVKAMTSRTQLSDCVPRAVQRDCYSNSASAERCSFLVVVPSAHGTHRWRPRRGELCCCPERRASVISKKPGEEGGGGHSVRARSEERRGGEEG